MCINIRKKKKKRIKKKEKRRNTFGDVCWYVVMTEGLFLVWGIPMFLNNKMNAFVE
jgi:hypothetical protein